MNEEIELRASMSITRRAAGAMACVAAVGTLSACGSKKSTATSSSGTPAGQADGATASDNWLTSTPAASAPVADVKWNLPYEPSSIDPTKASYFAENQVLTNLCEPLQQLQPDFSVKDGLAKATNPDPKTWVYDIAAGAKFWDGKPVTPADVKYNIEHGADKATASVWAFYVRNVASVAATGPAQVTVKLKKPDVLFNTGMATPAGSIVEKAFAEQAGKALGTPKGGVMCSGPFKFDKWTPGSDLTITKNDAYWNQAKAAKVSKITFSWLADDNSQTNALLSGALDGEYQVPNSAITRLNASSTGKVYNGKTLTQYMMIVKNLQGGLKDKRLRQALSMAIDRKALAATAFDGAAEPSRTLVTKATYSYAKPVYDQAWASYGEPKVDLAKAKALVAAARPTQQVVLAYPTGGTAYAEQTALAVADAGKKIGLDIKLKGVPNDVYNADTFDKKALKGVDLVLTSWFIDVPEPLIMYEQFLPEVSIYNLGDYTNPTFNGLIEKASTTGDPTARAKLLVKVEKIAREDLPWIPLVQQANLLHMSNKISGAPASFVQNYYPWARDLGGK